MERTAKEDIHDFHFLATGVGSVPFLDVRRTCRNILERFPEMPFWPQFVRRSRVEGMHIQFSEGLPLLELDESRENLVLSGRDRESRLVTFYEHFFAEDVDYFAVSRDYAPGLHTLIRSMGDGGDSPASYLKGQTIGPVTFGAGISDEDGKSILYDPDLMEAMVKGLAIKALWQVRVLETTGRRPVIFIDEPGLSNFGSAFSSIQRHEVVTLIKEMIDYLRERSDTLVGIHCCGNTDWSMIIEAGPDIISFDAFDYMDYFFLYPGEISDFLVQGGAIAWGIVPTAGFTGKESVEDIYSRLRDGLDRVAEWGMDPEALSRRSLLTPTCGMGTMEEPSADSAFDLLYRLAGRFGPAD